VFGSLKWTKQVSGISYHECAAKRPVLKSPGVEFIKSYQMLPSGIVSYNRKSLDILFLRQQGRFWLVILRQYAVDFK
jgi:hypothetical protein